MPDVKTPTLGTGPLLLVHGFHFSLGNQDPLYRHNESGATAFFSIDVVFKGLHTLSFSTKMTKMAFINKRASPPIPSTKQDCGPGIFGLLLYLILLYSVLLCFEVLMI